MRAEHSTHVFQRRNKPRHMQIAIIRRYCQNLCVIPLPIEIFRRFNAPLTACRTQRTRFPLSKQAQTHENSNNSAILTITIRYFSPIKYISAFKRSFHCIMRADRSARAFHRRNKPRHKQIAIVRRL